MKFKFLKATYLSALMAICSNANAGLIMGTDVVINTGSVSYQQFTTSGTGLVNWSLMGTPDGNDINANDGYDFRLFAGVFGSFTAQNEIGFFNSSNVLSKNKDFTLNAGVYTFAVGINHLSTTEAISGAASTPNDGVQTYSFSIDGLTVISANSPATVPEPSTLAIFALGLIGLASRRIKKQS